MPENEPHHSQFLARLEKADKAFAASECFPPIRWIKDVNPETHADTGTYADRVASLTRAGNTDAIRTVQTTTGKTPRAHFENVFTKFLLSARPSRPKAFSLFHCLPESAA
jgi:hypothetical protein